jgi:RND family efflux transporter MFP subunit
MKPYYLLLGLAAMLGACSDQDATNKAKAGPKPLQVEATSVARQSLGQSITRTGTLRAEQEVKLLAEEEGRVDKLPVYEGDRVKKGDLLLQLDDSQLRAEVKKATAQRKQARLDVRRLERLQNSKLITEDELARARTAFDIASAEEDLLQARLDNTRIVAPFDGVISQRLLEPGDVAAKFTHLLTLTSTDTLLAELAISELLLPGVAVGDEATIMLDALGDQRFSGSVLRVHPTVDPVTRQGIVEIRVIKPPLQAKPGQLCRVQLKLRPQSRLLLPFSALRRDTQGEFVYRIDSKQKARRTPVRSGIHLDNAVEILDGLSEGDRVITNGFLGLADGMLVKAANP